MFSSNTALAQSGGSAYILEAGAFSQSEKTDDLEPQILDFRYAPLKWQTCIGLPDDPHKTVVGSEGGLYYGFSDPELFNPDPYYDFHTSIIASFVGESEHTPVHQSILDARIPIVITEKKQGGLLLHEEVWARAPQSKNIAEWAPRRVDYLWLRMKNKGDQTTTGQLVLQVGSQEELVWDNNRLSAKENPKEIILSVNPAKVSVKRDKGVVKLFLPKKELAPGEEYQALVTLYPGKFAQPFNRSDDLYDDYKAYTADALNQQITAPVSVEKAREERARAIHFWQQAPLPYDRITVPDKAIQRLLDSSIRNIYQAREIHNGQPVFQVGPTYYRGSWAADGPFIMEAITYLGRWKEVRSGLEQQVDQDTGPGGVAFSKKLGLRLWMVWRHAQLTGDWQWLGKMWPRVKRDVETIIKYREMSRNDSSEVNDGLMPAGFGDGGLGGKHQEYSNVYWTLAGLRAAIQMAGKMNKPVLSDWQAEYRDYWETFDKARNRDKLLDARGNIYVPPVMTGEKKQLPQRGKWAFLQAVYPGRIFPKEDPLMLGTMAMLDDTRQEGLIYGTGWLAHGFWNYAASFYAHAHLWLEHGAKAASTLYAFANHASPLLVWREEQYPVGQQRGQTFWGDMPHNWASAEFIRLIRHLMILERGDELHLLGGLPKAWTRPGDETKLVDIPTSFGNMSLKISVAEDGQSVEIKIDPPRRTPPQKMIVHLEHFTQPIWSITADGNYLGSSGEVEIPADHPITLQVEFEHKAERRYSHPQNN